MSLCALRPRSVLAPRRGRVDNGAERVFHRVQRLRRSGAASSSGSASTLPVGRNQSTGVRRSHDHTSNARLVSLPAWFTHLPFGGVVSCLSRNGPRRNRHHPASCISVSPCVPDWTHTDACGCSHHFPGSRRPTDCRGRDWHGKRAGFVAQRAPSRASPRRRRAPEARGGGCRRGGCHRREARACAFLA